MNDKRMIDMDYDDLIDAKIDVEFYTIPDNVVKGAIRDVLKDYDLEKFPLAQYPYGFAIEFVEAIPLLHWLEVYNSARLMDGNERRENGTFYLDLFGSNMFPVINPTIVCKELGIDGSFDRLWREIIDYVGRIFNHWEKLEDDAFWIKARNHGKKKVFTYGLYQDNSYYGVMDYCVFTHTKKFTQEEFQDMYNDCVVLCKKEWDVDEPCMMNLQYWMNEKYGFEFFNPTVTYNMIDLNIEEMFVPNVELIKGEKDIESIFNNLNLEEKKKLKEMIEAQDESDIRNERIERLANVIEKKCESTSPNNADFEEAINIVEGYLKELVYSLKYYIPTTILIGDVELRKPVDCVKLEASDCSEIMDIVYFFKGDYGMRSFLGDISPIVFDEMLSELEKLLIKEE